MRINANLKAHTVEELLSRKRGMHLAAFTYSNAETARELERIAREGGLKDRMSTDVTCTMGLKEWLTNGGKEVNLEGAVVEDGKVIFTTQAVLGKLRRDCESVLARHAAVPAEQFVGDHFFRTMTEEMLETGTAAISTLRWYLEDRRHQIQYIMWMSLSTGYMGYLGFLERTIPEAGEARVAGAIRLCQALGVMESSPDELDAEGLTPLMRAAATGASVRVFRSLVAARADVEKRDVQGRTALYLAARSGHADALCELARLGADVHALAMPQSYRFLPITVAAFEGHIEAAEELVRLGANINHRGGGGLFEGCTPIHLAAWKGHTKMVKALARLGGDVNSVDRLGRTPSGIARESQNPETESTLEKLGGQ